MAATAMRRGNEIQPFVGILHRVGRAAAGGELPQPLPGVVEAVDGGVIVAGEDVTAAVGRRAGEHRGVTPVRDSGRTALTQLLHYAAVGAREDGVALLPAEQHLAVDRLMPQLRAGLPVVAGHALRMALISGAVVAAHHPRVTATAGATPLELVLMVHRGDAAVGVRDTQYPAGDVEPVDVDVGRDHVRQPRHLAGEVVDVSVIAPRVEPSVVGDDALHAIR
jgi:hypothetical protein